MASPQEGRFAAVYVRVSSHKQDHKSQMPDLERWAGLVERRGACHHPDGSVRFLRSTLAIFGTELTAHARGECSATSHRPFLPVPAGVPASQADWI